MRFKSSFVFAFLIFFLSLVFCQTSFAQQSWSDWVKDLRAEAIQNGIRPQLFDEVFSHIKEPNHSVLSLDRNQPEKRLTFLKYRSTRADAFRIKLGRMELKRNEALLTEIGNKYGVNPCIIVSLWGLETSYGRFMGKFPVVQSLATLAYDTRRAKFFRKELLYALEILNGGHVNYDDFKGEWAGASGHPQFLPSSWHKYAVDYDGDGRKDIWKSYPDVFASIANYLSQNGWQANQPWAIAVNVSNNAASLVNQKVLKSLSEWQQMGVQTLNGQPWPQNQNLQAQLIEPLGGPAFLIFNNFHVIMKWNRSNYYAGTVGYMAEQICQKPIL